MTLLSDSWAHLADALLRVKRGAEEGQPASPTRPQAPSENTARVRMSASRTGYRIAVAGCLQRLTGNLPP